MEQEVRALFIWNSAIGVVRVLPRLKVDHKSLVFGAIFVQLQRINQTLLSDEIRKAARRGRVQFFEEQSLHVRRPSFVQPEVRCMRMAVEDISG